MTRIAFDIGGVLSKEPDLYRELLKQLIAGGAIVFVVTDMHPRELVLETLRINGFEFVDEERVYVADYSAHGEGCKAEVCERLDIDILIDDFIGYVAPNGAPIRLLSMPDAAKPYYHPTWKGVAGDPDFGRRIYTESRGERRRRAIEEGIEKQIAKAIEIARRDGEVSMLQVAVTLGFSPRQVREAFRIAIERGLLVRCTDERRGFFEVPK